MRAPAASQRSMATSWAGRVGWLRLAADNRCRSTRTPWPHRLARPSAARATGAHQTNGVEVGEASSTSGRSNMWQRHLPLTAAAAAAAYMLLPAGCAHAAEAVPDGMLEFVITYIEALGPWGPAAFVATVAIAECIPLFPTQPLSLASGLLFGAQKGSLCMLSGATLAALLAFSIARGIGRPLAERIISHEIGGGSSGSEGGLVQRKLHEVQEGIERGSFWQQAGAVLLLRMTPLVPYSASNYVLGLSPLPLAPYLAGTVAGMAFWSVFYASLGGASRSLLRSGVDPDVLVADLLVRAGSYTREAAAVGVVLVAGALLYLIRRQFPPQQAAGSSGSSASDSSGPAASGAASATGEQLGLDLSQGLSTGRELVAERAERLREWASTAAERLGPKEGLAED